VCRTRLEVFLFFLSFLFAACGHSRAVVSSCRRIEPIKAGPGVVKVGICLRYRSGEVVKKSSGRSQSRLHEPQ